MHMMAGFSKYSASIECRNIAFPELVKPFRSL